MVASVRKYLVRDIMSSPLITSSPIKNVNDIAELMVENDIGAVVIVNDDNSLLGIVTKSDIIREVVAKGLQPINVSVGQIMTKNPYYAFDDTPLDSAAELMGSKGIGHLPILDSSTSKPIGILSKRDILKLAPHYIELVYQLKARKS
ncbi:MAG: CBS domain-containing protein [Caldisphaeraceae archaeon]|nr:CBS domain-containing protein [Caldisphaeraceae archaeon]